MMSLLRIYWKCLAGTPRAVLKAPWMVVVPSLYAVVLQQVASLASPLGIIGGFLVGFVAACLAASFLYGVAELVSGNKLIPSEMVNGARRYLGPVMNVGFVIWIASIVEGLAVTNLPNGPALLFALNGVAVVLLNATPEAIYLRRAFTGMEILAGVFGFIQEHWLEWFLPNIPMLGLYYVGVPILLMFVPASTFGSILGAVIEGAVLLPIFVFRGLLFEALDGRRRGAFQWANRR